MNDCEMEKCKLICRSPRKQEINIEIEQNVLDKDVRKLSLKYAFNRHREEIATNS